MGKRVWSWKCPPKVRVHPHKERMPTKARPLKERAYQHDFLESMLSKGCAHCGCSLTRATTHWHHKDNGKTKLFSVYSTPISWTAFLIEYSKCEPLCILCHRRHHAKLRKAARKKPHFKSPKDESPTT